VIFKKIKILNIIIVVLRMSDPHVI